MSVLQKILLSVVALCGLLTVGAVLIWAPTCPGVLELANGNASPMRCAYTGKMAILLALVEVVVAAAGILSKRPMTVPIVAIGVALILVTFESFIGIGVCKSEMACWTTAAWIRMCAGVSIAAALATAWSGTSKRQVLSGQ